MGSTNLRENNVLSSRSGTTTHPYGDATESKVPAQYEFTAVSRSIVDAKGVPADTGLKLLAAAMRNRWRARECLEGIMIFEFVGCILVIIFLVFLWKEKL